MLPSKDYFAHSSSIIDEGCDIGADTKIWHFCHIMRDCHIGNNCNIGQNVVIMPNVILGNHVKVQNNVSLYTGVICEDYVFLGPSSVFTNVTNPRSAVKRHNEFKQILICKGATIGANATIICGHRIGRFAFVGAGAVVTKDVPDYALVLGNPAKHVGWMSEKGHKLVFNEMNEATCIENGDDYILENGIVRKKNDP